MGLFNVFRHPKSGGYQAKLRGNTRPSFITPTQGAAISACKSKNPGAAITPNRVRNIPGKPTAGKFRKV